MLVSYTEMRSVKTIFLSSNGVFDNFGAFCKVESPIFGFLDKNLQENAKLCIQKSYWFCAGALFQKFVSPHTNSSGGKGLIDHFNNYCLGSHNGAKTALLGSS